MTLSSQLDAASSSRKSSKKSSRQQKKTSSTTHPPDADVKTNIFSKQKKSVGTNGKKDTLLPSQDTLLRRSFSIRKRLSNLVSSGGSSLKRSLSFGKGLNEHLLGKSWSASLQSLREDVPSNGEETPVLSCDVRDGEASVFDSRKLVTRTQSLLVRRTRTEEDVDAKEYKVSCCLYLTSDFSLLMFKI
jgi:hypothetical protein